MQHSPHSDIISTVRQFRPETFLFPSMDAARFVQQVCELQKMILDCGVYSGELVALRASNTISWVEMMLAVMEIGAKPLLLPENTIDGEFERICLTLGGIREIKLTTSPQVALSVTGTNPSGKSFGRKEKSLFLSTSGTTGSPKLVERTVRSLMDEARRYRDGIGVNCKDRILLPLPIHHAYGLAWLMTSLFTGALVRLVAPSDFNAINQGIHEDPSTILVLTASLARILAIRKRTRPNGHLRIAMVGAGPVDAQLEELFEKRFGLKLARNYGSTETGTIAAGFPPLPPYCVGPPLPGIQVRIKDDTGSYRDQGNGRLEVQVNENAPWHSLGDIVDLDSQGLITIVGRENESIRKGGRWVSPKEIETVLRNFQDVLDVRLTKKSGRHAEDEKLCVDILPMYYERFDRDVFSNELETKLSAHKRPDIVRTVRSLEHTELGKTKQAIRYKLADFDPLLKAVIAYKQTEMLFALSQLDVLKYLNGRFDAFEIAQLCGLDPDALQMMLSIAAALDLVSSVADDNPSDSLDKIQPFLDLEEKLSRTYVTRDELCNVLKNGVQMRRFDQAPLQEGFLDSYQKAIFNDANRVRALLALRRLRPKNSWRFLEISNGPGTYSKLLFEKLPKIKGVLLHSGKLSDKPHAELCERIEIISHIKETSGPFDCCIVCNRIHGPWPGDDLRLLMDLVKPEGTLLIDDIFLPKKGKDCAIGLDWLTHGGLNFWHYGDLDRFCKKMGWEISENSIPGAALHRQIFITMPH